MLELYRRGGWRRWLWFAAALLVLGGAAGLILLLAGCSSLELPQLVEALGKDPSTLCLTAAVGTSTVRLARTQLTTGELRCTGDGLQVTPAARPAR